MNLASYRCNCRPALFVNEYGARSRNFMTPDLIGYYSTSGVAVEIAKGEGLSRNTIYGVSCAIAGQGRKGGCSDVRGGARCGAQGVAT